METDYERREREARENQVIASVRARIKANPDFLNKMFQGLTREELARFLKAQAEVFKEHLVVARAAQAALVSMIEAEKGQRSEPKQVGDIPS